MQGGQHKHPLAPIGQPKACNITRVTLIEGLVPISWDVNACIDHYWVQAVKLLVCWALTLQPSWHLITPWNHNEVF